MTPDPNRQESGCRVAVGLVLHDSSHFVAPCLSALRAQSIASDLDLVLVDNASFDGGAAIAVSAWPGARLITNRENLGFAAAQNQAISCTDAPFFLTVNPDVVLDRGYVELLRRCLLEDPRAGAATGVLRRPHGGVDTAGLAFLPWKRLAIDIEAEPRGMAAAEVFGTSAAAAVYRRSALKSVSLEGEVFDEDFFSYLEDVDLAWRLRQHGWSAKVVPQAGGTHARGAANPETLRKVRGLILRNRYLMLVKNEAGWSPSLLVALTRDVLRLARLTVREPAAVRRLLDLRRLIPRALARRRRQVCLSAERV